MLAYRRSPRRIIVTFGAALVFLLTPRVTLAWNQLLPDPDEAGYNSCQNTGKAPCIEWAKTSQNLSINVDVYLSYTLSQQNLDLKPDVRAVFPKWNQIAARNPHLQETTSTTNEEIWVTVADLGIPDVTGFTDPSHGGAPAYTISSARVYFNQGIAWNHSYSFGCNSGGCYADSRKVAAHEFGHAEGLAHVDPAASYAAIMKQGPATSWWPHVDDENGIIAIYGAYP